MRKEHICSALFGASFPAGMRCQMLALLALLCSCLGTRYGCWALGGAAAAVTQPTCNLKDNCNLGENLLTVAGDGDPVETHIASIFEDKVNYSLKLFADDASAAGTSSSSNSATTTTVLDVLHDALAAGNLTELHHHPASNYTLRHLSDRRDEDQDQSEEEERGK